MSEPANLAWKIAERELDFLIHEDNLTSNNYGAGKAFFFHQVGAIAVGIQMSLDSAGKGLTLLDSNGVYTTLI